MGRLTDLIVASFGLGSFIEDTTQMLRRFYRWLKKDGYLVISFYNDSSLIQQVTPNWRDTSLSAHLETDNNTLKVSLNKDTTFHIFCKPYSKTILSAVKQIFDIDENNDIRTFPTFMSLLPNTLLKNDVIYNLSKDVDLYLSSNNKHKLGYYVTLIAKKPNSTVKEAYHRIISLLHQQKFEYETINHNSVQTTKDVLSELIIDTNKALMVKTVVFCRKPKQNKQIIVVVLPHYKRVDKTLVGKKLNISHNYFYFATEKELFQMGFPLGGLAPFGFKNDQKYELFVDSSILSTNIEWIYTGIGDNRKTLKINSTHFKEIVKDYMPIDL